MKFGHEHIRVFAECVLLRWRQLIHAVFAQNKSCAQEPLASVPTASLRFAELSSDRLFQTARTCFHSKEEPESTLRCQDDNPSSPAIDSLPLDTNEDPVLCQRADTSNRPASFLLLAENLADDFSLQ